MDFRWTSGYNIWSKAKFGKRCLLPDLGLLLGFGGGHDTGRLPAGLLLQPRPAVAFVLPLPPGLVLRRRAGEALRAHDSWNVLLAALPGLGDGFGYYPVSLFLLVLHLMVRPPLARLFRRRAG